MAEFAGKGTTALGIIGTVLGSLGVAGNGSVGNLLGGWGNGCCGDNMPVTRYEQAQESRIAKLESEVALRDANIYNDQKSLELYKYFDAQIKMLQAQVSENEIKHAKIDGAFAILGEKLAQEKAERCCGDNSIVTYANATFYPKMVADVTVGTTSTAQATYNPVYNCGCCNK